MSARICVDYLSHEWYPNDLINTHREIRRQVRKANSKHSDDDDDNSNNSSPSDKYRLARFENALWRQMGRTLTDHLGKHNPLVDPAVVDWQKESDITWLYGPMYAVEHDDKPSLSLFTQKKKRRRQRQRQGSVRFDPNVIQYSPPPIPTPSPSPSPLSSHSLYALIDSDDEEGHDHDDVVGNMFAGVSQSIQSYFFSTKQPLSAARPFMVAEFSIVWAAAAFLRSVASVLATWVMYKSLGRLIRRTWQIRQQEEPRSKHIQHTTATSTTTTTITTPTISSSSE